MEGGVEIQAEEIAARKRAPPPPLMTTSLQRGQLSLRRGNLVPARRDPSFVAFLTRPNGPGPVMPGTLSSHAKGDGVGASRCGNTIYYTCGTTKSLPH
eukprot:7113817-Pyramimonas_sp.AAC.1